MKILLINPPHTSIGSRMAGEHLPPLGLLAIGGPLLDAGHNVKLLEADYSNMPPEQIVYESFWFAPDCILMGHSGSTSAQPVINELAMMLKSEIPFAKIIIGGVFPTYHWNEILIENKAIDIIVCGEGEKVAVNLVEAMEKHVSLETVRGIAFRLNGIPVKTQSETLIKDLNAHRIGWELMKRYHYTYWGKKKAVVIQFSRGCPYPCSYCGQSLFWQKWRHRDPQLLAEEIEMLHDKYGIEVINFADENPSTNKKAWKEFLEALIKKNLNLILVGSIRADNVHRDADILHLYKKAGFERLLLGIENYDENVLKKIKKGGEVSKDREAIRLLRKHGILSMATYVVGFGEETVMDFYHNLRHLLSYDPDQIQLLYATPHRWTPYFKEVENKKVLQYDKRKWDYKHLVMAPQKLKPWMIVMLVKLTEVIMQARPKAIIRLLFHKEARLKAAMRWYTNIGRRVWFHEVLSFFFKDKFQKNGMTMKEFWTIAETKHKPINNKKNDERSVANPPPHVLQPAQ